MDNTVRIWDSATGTHAATIHTGFTAFLRFDQVDFNHLHTSIGTFDLESIDPKAPMPHDSKLLPKPYGYGISVEALWITHGGLKLLWLPADYRPVSPSSFAISRNTLIIGCSSGRVIFLTLS
jgi:hypothetical protein